MSKEDYDQKREFLGIVTSDEGVTLLPAHPQSVSALAFWKSHAARIWREIKRCVGEAGIVHSGMSADILRPLMAMVNLAAWQMGKPVIFVVDIDFRRHSWRLRRLRMWSLRSYLTNRLFHDPLRWIQVWLAPRMFDLVLLKSPDLARDFGRGRLHVKNFLDTAHSMEHVLTDTQLKEHLVRLRRPEGPLRIVYFGRLVAYKGLDRAIDAVRIARETGEDVRLTIIGDGPCLEALRQQARSHGLETEVTFLPPVTYGEPLFSLLSDFHLAIATPLTEDTPRSAFDAMARGLPIIAFDLAYFAGLAELSGAVALARWPCPQSVAETLVELNRDRNRLAEMANRAVNFARANTQQIWLDRRRDWTLRFILGEPRG
jgi:glycosyltransferase involved in cell wall biosynthesis